MSNKYPGGYQIIDMKGLKASVSPIADSEIIEKLEYALSGKKPLYIANYNDNMGFLLGPILMKFNSDSEKFVHTLLSETGAPIASVYLYKDTGAWYFASHEA